MKWLKWLYFVLQLLPAFLFFMAAIKWYGKTPNWYGALGFVVGSMLLYNAMRYRDIHL